MYYAGLVPVEIMNDIQQFWQYMHACCLINQWCQPNSYGFEDFTSLHPDRQQLMSGLALDQTLFDLNVSDSQNMENFEEEMIEQIRFDTITPEEEFEEFVEELATFSDDFDEEYSSNDVIQPKPCTAAMSATGDATTASTGHATKSYADVVGRNNLPNLVGAGSGDSIPELLKRRELLEETIKSKFLAMSASYQGSQTIFVNNKKIYYKGKSLYANYAKTLPREFISVIKEMSSFEEDWIRYHSEMMGLFQILQKEFQGEYPSLNVLTYKWFKDPECETFDYVSDHNAVKSRFKEHSEIRSNYGF